jgi:hypothetical protein
LATPAGIEGHENLRETQGKTANEREDEGSETPVRNDSRGAENDPDAALKMAIKAAVDAGQYERAAKLLEVLRATPPAKVLELLKRR